MHQQSVYARLRPQIAAFQIAPRADWSGSGFDETDPYMSGVRYESDEAKIRKFMVTALGGEWRHAPKTMASVPASEKTHDEEASLESPHED